MNTWILVILFGISNWGNAGLRKVEFDSKEKCFEALSKTVIVNAPNSEGGIVAYCQPKEE